MSEQGVIILIEERDRSKVGGEEEVCCECVAWMKGVCARLSVHARGGPGRFFCCDRAVTVPGREALGRSLCGVKAKQLHSEAVILF